MMRSTRRAILRASLAARSMGARTRIGASLAALASAITGTSRARSNAVRDAVTAAQVERAILAGVGFLKSQQRGDGSWPNPGNHHQHAVGPTSLALHALLISGEPKDSEPVTRGLNFLESFSPEKVDGSYSVGLQTIVFAEVDPARYAVRLASNVAWLERAQIREGDGNPGWPGSWTHTSDKSRRGDNSSTQFALLGLDAARQAGIPVKPEVWALARTFLERGQRQDGGWPYYPSVLGSNSTASMTCAGISGLILTGQGLETNGERLEGETIHGCGRRGTIHPGLARGLGWLGSRFSVAENPGSPFFGQWLHYYLYGMERVGRFTGLRLLGGHDWYREGAAELVATQDSLIGSWTGVAIEREPTIATSLALLFLSKGRAPVLIHKLKHGSGNDWNNDPDDIRNLVGLISDAWKHTLAWQTIDAERATVEEMLQAPIAYLSGHEAPRFSEAGKRRLREFVERGGFLLAEACCGDERFDRGFRDLIGEIFPDESDRLEPLPEDHAIWRAHHLLSPEVHPLWGIARGCRTSVVYSPEDLSCSWNQMRAHPSSSRVIKAQRVGRNIIDYATGREIPADKLAVRETSEIRGASPKRGQLHIAKLRHAGDWNIAPLAIPNLAASLASALKFDVVIDHKELFPTDPNLAYYPLVYVHGKSALSFDEAETEALRRHCDPGGGTLFADAACGSPAFDASFRRLVEAMFPGNPLMPIPPDDPIYTTEVGYDLSNCQLSHAAGGGTDAAMLEGVKIDGHWGVIYSKIDLGCALAKHAGLDCKSYRYESALKIAANIVIDATNP